MQYYTKNNIIGLQAFAEQAIICSPMPQDSESCVLVYTDNKNRLIINVKPSFGKSMLKAKNLFKRKNISSVIFSFNDLPDIKHTIVGSKKHQDVYNNSTISSVKNTQPPNKH